MAVLLRFLHEDPWRRLDLLRQKVPDIPFQVKLYCSSREQYMQVVQCDEGGGLKLGLP